jgi:3-dehydrosphinganine reductase
VRLAEAGANVALMARRPDPLAETVSELETLRRFPEQRWWTYSVDVGDRAAVGAAVADLLGQTAVDALINNAGVACAERMENTPPEAFEEAIRINYLGCVWTTLALLPHFKARNAGHIANVASLAGVLGFFGYAAYAPSKFALMGFSEVLRNELCRYNIPVTVLLPPDTDTPQLAFENRTKPAETRAIAGNAAVMDADVVARKLLRGMAKRRFHVVPGFMGKASYYLMRWAPWLVRWVMNRAVRGCPDGGT